MKRSIFTIAASLLIFASCTAPKTHGELTKLAPYLYQMDYYDMDESLFDGYQPGDTRVACSSVRNGAFHGRNLDLYYNEGVEVVVKMAAGKGRFASLAVCGATPYLTDERISECDENDLKRLPYITMDGINENGVVINTNVVPAADYPYPTGTRPGARRVYLGLVPRYVLNYASSAANAVELLGGLDLYGGFGEKYNLHFMISDPKETYIVEFKDNKICWVKGERTNESNIMTNLFSTCLPELTLHSEGVERYEILQANYAEGCTEEGMTNLMKRVKFTQAYERTTDPFWYSEDNGITTLPDGTVIDRTINTPHEETLALKEKDFQAYERHERNGEFWQTVNTSIYNIDSLSLLLFVQENYDQSFRFSLK